MSCSIYSIEETFALVNQKLLTDWQRFTEKNSIPSFLQANSWSFSSIFKESPSNICRVKKLGCDIVEMETATLYAIGQEKGIGTLSLFVISDSIRLEEWIPYIKEPSVRNNLNQLADWSLDFFQRISSKTPIDQIDSK